MQKCFQRSSCRDQPHDSAGAQNNVAQLVFPFALFFYGGAVVEAGMAPSSPLSVTLEYVFLFCVFLQIHAHSSHAFPIFIRHD